MNKIFDFFSFHAHREMEKELDNFATTC